MTEIHRSTKEMFDEQLQHIINKLTLRNGLAAEHMPVAQEDTRNPWLIEYEKNVYDNPDSVGFRNSEAARMAAIMQNVKIEPKDFILRLSRPTALVVETGVVVKLVDTPSRWSWEKNDDVLRAGTLLVVTGNTPANKPKDKAYAGLPFYRTFADDTSYRLSLDTWNATYANEKEIAEFVNGIFKGGNKHSFVKALGDAVEFTGVQLSK